MFILNKINLMTALHAMSGASPAAILSAAAISGAAIGSGGWYATHSFRGAETPPVTIGSQTTTDKSTGFSGSTTPSESPKPGAKPSDTQASKASGAPAVKTGSQASSPLPAAGGSQAGGTNSAAPAAPTYASETAYAAPAFTAARVVDVYSQSAFNTAWNAIQPGDLISVHGVTFSGEVTLANKNLAGWAEIHFDPATKFVGVSTVQNVPAVWINNDSYIRFYGGDISDSASGGQAGPGILVYDSSYITWWGFVSHDVGRDGLDIFSVNKANSNLDFKGEVYHWGLNLAWDPHAEKGTGLHGANLGDSNYGMQDSRIALYAHDGAAGAGVEAGGASSTDFFKNNTIYLWCQNLTMVALSQTGGNCLQFWGENVTGNVIKYLEAENLQGRPYETGGMYSGQSLASNTIVYGRAANTNLNQKINDSIPQNVLWDYQFGTIFEDISPTP